MSSGISHSINVLVRGKNALTKALTKAENSLTSFRKTAEKASVRINKLPFSPDVDMKKVKEASGHLTSVGTKAMLTGLVMAGGFGLAARSAVRFESSMAEVSTLVDTSETNMSDLSNKVKELSVRFGQMPIATAKALYTTISAGFADSAQATILLEGAMKLARGGLAELDISIDGLTSVLNSYGMTAKEVNRVSDYMFVAMRAGKTTIGELSSELGKATPLASAVGVSIEELLSATSALTLGGLRTGEAVTSLRGIFTALVKQSSESVKSAKKLGIEFNTTALKSMGLHKWLSHIAEKTGGSQEALSSLFGRVEALTGAIALTGNQSKSFVSILDQMKGAAGSTETAFRKIEETSEAAFARFKASMDVFMATVGNKIVPIISTLASVIGFAAGKLSAFGQAHPFLTRILVTLGAVTSAVLVLGGAGLIMAGQIVLAMAMINVSTGGLLLVIGAVITGVTALVVAFTTGFNEMGIAGKWLSSIWGYIKKGFYAMATPVAYGIGYLSGLITSAWNEIVIYTKSVWPLIRKLVMRSMTIMTAFMLPQLAVMTGVFTFVWKSISVIVKAAWDFIELTVFTKIELIKNSVKIGWHAISGIFKAGLQILTGDFKGAWQTIKITFSNIWSDILEIFNTNIQYLTGLGKIFYKAGEGYIGAMLDGVMTSWNKLKSGFTDIMGWIRDLLPGSDAKKGPLSDLTKAGRAFMPTFSKGVKENSNTPVKTVKNVFSKINILKHTPNPVNFSLPNKVAQTDEGRSKDTHYNVENHPQVVFERGAFNIVINGTPEYDDFEDKLTNIFSKAAMKLGAVNV